MKATGIVRRIDDLGRVVIPKEIRKTMRIREGDPLEIYTDREGEVIFKKYSPIGELNTFASHYAETLYKTCSLCVVICDRDSIIACAGVPRRDFLDKRVGMDVEAIMESRSLYLYDSEKKDAALRYVLEEHRDWHITCAMPMITQGDIVGCVLAVEKEGATPSEEGSHPKDSDTQQRLIRTAAAFLSKQLDS